jgi:N-methylhydantoinase B
MAPAMSDPESARAHTAADPIIREIIKGALRSIQGEMEAVLERTAMSAFIREKKDFFVALFSPDGRMVIGTSLPFFGDVIGPILSEYPASQMLPGDVYWFNDCYGSAGAVSHSSDQVFVCPVFHEGLLAGFVQSWAHFSDIGGMRPGSLSPEATDVFQEGIIIPPVKLYASGILNEEAFRIFVRNSRFPEMVVGDMRALSAAVHLGEMRLQELLRRFGGEVVLQCFSSMLEETERIVRARFRRIFPNGSYEFQEIVDQDGHGNGPFVIRLRLVVDEQRIVLDTTATDDQAVGPINFLMHPAVPGFIFGIYFLAEDATTLLNDGVCRILDEVRLRSGSLVQPAFPAPLGMRGLTLTHMMNACAGLINVATGGYGVAASNAYCIHYLRGPDPQSSKPFLLTDGVAVGYGARPTADGIDAIYLTAQENYPAEFLESVYPVRLTQYAINPDSAGPGRWRGGCGVIRELVVLQDGVTMSTRMDGCENPPWGVNGGKPGRAGRYVVNPGRHDERILNPLSEGTLLNAGDVVRVETGGGGGWGDPYEREPDQVLSDVLGGFISARAALDDYGVVLGVGQATVDYNATYQQRGRWASSDNPPDGGGTRRQEQQP